MSKIKLPCFDIKILCDDENIPYKITSSLKDYFEIRKGSHTAADLTLSMAVDVIEGFILSHAKSGIDVSSKEYVDGIESLIASITRHCFMISKEELFD